MIMPKINRNLGCLYIVPFLLTGIDQASKFLMLELIFTQPRIINVTPFLNFTPVWNKGISFGLLGNAGPAVPVLLTIVALSISALLPFISRQWDRSSKLGAQLMAGGALGNAIDRIIHGKVVDFIDFFAGQWHWPAFNVADSLIFIGAVFILWGSIKDSRSQSKSKN